MKRYLSVINLLVLVLLVNSYQDVYGACKRKKKRKAVENRSEAKMKDSLLVVRAPGVPDQASHDSLKSAKMLQKMKLSNEAFVVSFISLASGIDSKEALRFEEEFKAYNEKSNCKLHIEKKNWGREGERDYCVLSSDEKCMTDFIKIVKSKFSGNRRILIKEHSTCK